MTLPDFLIVGAMKCGTSTLQAQLAAQPGVFMTTPKEPNFFSDDEIYARGLDWYESLFAPAEPGDLKGEASTHYTKRPLLPRTLDRMAPVLAAPRLIYMIRNPVERAVSHYMHEWSRGSVGPDMPSAFAERPDFVDFGRYAMQIEPFIDHYGPGSVLLTSLERLTAEPQAELERICGHIGYAGRPVWADIPPQNVSAERVRPLPLHGLLVDNPVATALRRALVPKSLRTRIRKARSMQDRPQLGPDLRARLQETFLADRDRLARLFPAHPALTDAYPFAAP